MYFKNRSFCNLEYLLKHLRGCYTIHNTNSDAIDQFSGIWTEGVKTYETAGVELGKEFSDSWDVGDPDWLPATKILFYIFLENEPNNILSLLEKY